MGTVLLMLLMRSLQQESNRICIYDVFLSINKDKVGGLKGQDERRKLWRCFLLVDYRTLEWRDKSRRCRGLHSIRSVMKNNDRSIYFHQKKKTVAVV